METITPSDQTLVKNSNINSLPGPEPDISDRRNKSTIERPFTPSKIKTRSRTILTKPLLSKSTASSDSSRVSIHTQDNNLNSNIISNYERVDRPPYVPAYGTQQYQRYWYYNRLAMQSGFEFEVPKSYLYSVPSELVIPKIVRGKGQKTGSLQTIFSLWNTMMGSVLLTLPWGFTHAGFATGLVLIFVFGLIAWYSATLIYKATDRGKSEFIDVATHYFGRTGRFFAVWGSISILVGISIAYFILMNNSIYSFIGGLMTIISGGMPTWFTAKISTLIPMILILPFVYLKSFGIIVKLNSIGVFCMLYISSFIIIESVNNWEDLPIAEEFNVNFYFLCGILSCAFFVHNFIVTLLKNHKTPEKAQRDMTIGFSLTAMSYLVVGGTAYLAFGNDLKSHQDFFTFFPLIHKYCMSARFALSIQMVSVLPLVIFMARSQILTFFTGNEWPNVAYPVILATCIVILDVIFAMFYPAVGDIIRFVGASTGFLYMYILPALVNLARKKQENRRRWWDTLFKIIFIIFGGSVFLIQFIPSK